MCGKNVAEVVLQVLSKIARYFSTDILVPTVRYCSTRVGGTHRNRSSSLWPRTLVAEGRVH